MEDFPNTFIVNKTQYERMWKQKSDKNAPFDGKDIRHLYIDDSINPSTKTIDVLVPGPLSPIRGALASCAIEGNQFAIDALETIRRVENHEPVGARYATALNSFLEGK